MPRIDSRDYIGEFIKADSTRLVGFFNKPLPSGVFEFTKSSEINDLSASGFKRGYLELVRKLDDFKESEKARLECDLECTNVESYSHILSSSGSKRTP